MLSSSGRRLNSRCNVEYTPLWLLTIWICVSFYAYGEMFCYVVLSREGVNFEFRTHKLLFGLQLSTLLYGLPAAALLFPSRRKRDLSASKRLFFCKWCHDVIDGNTVHCLMCQTCIPKHYTHSVLFNTCIGQENIVEFLQFFLFFALSQGYAFKTVLQDFLAVDASHLSPLAVAYYLAVTLAVLVVMIFHFCKTLFYLAFDMAPGKASPPCSDSIVRGRPLENLRAWLGPYWVFALFVPAFPFRRNCPEWSRLWYIFARCCPRLRRSVNRGLPTTYY